MFERILAAIAPARALRRAHARLVLRNLQARYDAARTSRRTRGWRADATGPNAEVQGGLVTVRDRSRDLVRNNPFASAALDLLVSYQVGTGIIPRSATGDNGLDRDVDAVFADWARTADISGRRDFWGLQALVARSRSEAGEALTVLVPMGRAAARQRGMAVPLALQVIEPDHLDVGCDEDSGGRRIRQGIELDGVGAPIGYWLRDNHPGERDGIIGQRIGQLSRYAAQDVLHVFKQDRPGQLRGMPDLAPVMTRLRALDELEDAALESMKVQACLAAFVTTQAPAGRGPLEGADSETGDPVKSFSPGMIERLLPGEDVKFAEPTGSGGFSETARHQLHAIATGFGLTYDLMTGDLSQANYSSLRAGRLAFKRRLEAAQWLMLVPQFCQPVWDAFIRMAMLSGAIPPRAGAWPVQWAPPRFELVDPLKDTAALNAMVRSGFMTWGQAVAEFGWDPRAQADEIKRWNAEHDEYGLILDGDPRRTGGSGGAQDSKVNSAIEIAATGLAATNTPPPDQNAPAASFVLSDGISEAVRGAVTDLVQQGSAAVLAAADAAQAAQSALIEARQMAGAQDARLDAAMAAVQDASAAMAAEVRASVALNTDAVRQVAQEVTRPRKATVQRDETGRITGNVTEVI